MRVCIIGNSHVGALKRAWDEWVEVNTKEGYRIDFFAASSNRLNMLTFEEGKLLSKNKSLMDNLKFTSGGKSFIDLDTYDVFLLHGLAKPYFTNNTSYSKAVTNAAVQDWCSGLLSLNILKMIRKGTNAKVFIGHIPLPANKNVDNGEFNNSFTDQYIIGVSLINEYIFSSLNAELLLQPLQTIAGNGRNTYSRFSKGSKGLEINDHLGINIHTEEDNRHMNDEFGKLWFDGFLNKVVISKG